MAHILIVDDDEIVAEMAADTLISAGHACGWVTSGESALKLLRFRRPDMILLDQDMPGMSGAQVLRKLRTSQKLYDMPVVMFTAVTGSEDEDQAIYAGAQDYIRKPFEPEFLKLAVSKLLKKRDGREKHLDLIKLLEQSSGMAPEIEHNYKRAV
ncbi:MAG: response regulator [Erythrobacter sp.]